MIISTKAKVVAIGAILIIFGLMLFAYSWISCPKITSINGGGHGAFTCGPPENYTLSIGILIGQLLAGFGVVLLIIAVKVKLS
ncbi:MAG TPA: hypothetical protein VND15_03475 [Candidatus Acidoferrales bacterium]|nr:hypothetical protein [Candidatus Acidoferrales bacterium]